MSHTFHERVFDTVFTLEHDIYFGIVQIQSPRAPPFQWFKNVMVWIVEVLIALFSKKWSKICPVSRQTHLEISAIPMYRQGGEGWSVMDLMRIHSFSSPCSPWLEQGSTIKITGIGEKHQKNSLNITTVHNMFQPYKKSIVFQPVRIGKQWRPL